MVNRRIETKDDFPLIALAFDDLYVFRRQYGDRAYDKMIDRAIRKCHRLYGQKNVYILNGDIFAIEPKYDSSDTAIDRLSAIFGTRIKVGDEYFTFAPHFCVLSEHKKAESASDINASINDMLVDVFRKTGERVIYDASEMLKDKHREEEIVHILRDALTNDGFDVYYQPLYDPVEKKYIAAEALVRLCNQSIGYISPDEFIPKRKFQ